MAQPGGASPRDRFSLGMARCPVDLVLLAASFEQLEVSTMMAKLILAACLVYWFSLFTAPAAGQTKFTIGYAAISPRTTPLIVAQEQGLFAKHGLEARLVLIRGAPTSVASLISSDIEVGYTGGTAVVGAAAQGLYLKILSSVSNKLTYTLIASPNIKRAEDLRGQRFGIQSIGGSTWMHTMLTIEHVGLDVKRDHLSLLVVGDSVLIGQSLEVGRIDAATLDGALIRRLRSKGFSVIAELQPANIPMVNQAIVVS
jgi:NitT/TauT family transport system substrate-binding protein